MSEEENLWGPSRSDSLEDILKVRSRLRETGLHDRSGIPYATWNPPDCNPLEDLIDACSGSPRVLRSLLTEEGYENLKRERPELGL